MGQLNESERTVAIYDADMPSNGRSSSMLALAGTPGNRVRLIGTYHTMDEVPQAHIDDKNIWVVGLQTALHIFHFQPEETGVKSE